MSWWNSTISIRRASRIHESWHETIDGKIKIQIDTFTHKTETNQVDQFLLCQVFLLFWLQSFRALDTFPKARSATWSTLRTQTRRLVRRLSRRRVGGWCFSSDIAHNTTLVHNLVILWRIYWRGRECLNTSPKLSTISTFTVKLHPFPEKTSKCGLQVHVHTSHQYQLETPKIEGIFYFHHNQWPSIPTTC